jgi:hypothetical protein
MADTNRTIEQRLARLEKAVFGQEGRGKPAKTPDKAFDYSGPTGYGGPWFGNRAYQISFQDGVSVGRRDIRERKPYNPNPRGPYDDEDHGYSSA